jgi:hypothetical protein
MSSETCSKLVVSCRPERPFTEDAGSDGSRNVPDITRPPLNEVKRRRRVFDNDYWRNFFNVTVKKGKRTVWRTFFKHLLNNDQMI